jgi:hypothetical protein
MSPYQLNAYGFFVPREDWPGAKIEPNRAFLPHGSAETESTALASDAGTGGTSKPPSN